MLRRIDKKVQIHRAGHCPIQLKDCALFYDRASDTYSLQLSLQNDSGMALRELAVYVVGYDGQGQEVGSQRINYHFKKSMSGQYMISADRGLQLPIERVSRLTARIGQAWGAGRYGERVDLLGELRG